MAQGQQVAEQLFGERWGKLRISGSKKWHVMLGGSRGRLRSWCGYVVAKPKNLSLRDEVDPAEACEWCRRKAE